MHRSAVAYGRLPFDEAIAFFRDKLSMPSRHWDDLTRDQHAKGFMVAGAMKAELLTDLRGAVDRVIAEGGTLETFRKDFDKIVADHGWRYKGGRNWRTRVIYQTNLRQSYNAGRWEQMTAPEVVKLRPYLMYRHSGSANPREQHLAWHGLVLPVDHPFWSTHAPQNGWGCNCRLDSVSGRDLERMGKKGPDTAPKIEYREYTDREGKTRRVPHGIDPGFDYNAGKARDRSYKVLADRFETLPRDVARPFVDEFLRGPVFKRFYDGGIAGEFPVAVLNTAGKAALGTRTQTVWLSRTAIDAHKTTHPGIGRLDYQHVPEIIDRGEVYKQGQERLVYLKTGGRLYRAVLNQAREGEDSYYLTVLAITDEKAIREARETLRRVR